ncbi:AAA family ATPase [uncultured Pantoea sp.]|uniref:AAA family ATPase n=1 Tax=uncultured Pantoea sp. TaxID=218084 RepID=UPI0025EF5644|nr:AAA family ATPase [uncultured Pantoea sp.]
MMFHVVKQSQSFNINDFTTPFVLLKEDNWNDYSYKTQYFMSIYTGKHHKIFEGQVKIVVDDNKKNLISNELNEYNYHTLVPRLFENLEPGYYSVGSGESYYERLSKIDDSIRETVLVALNDIAFNTTLLEEVRKSNSNVYSVSLMREYNETDFLNRISRVAKGGVILTPFDFEFEYLLSENNKTSVTAKVRPNTFPPTNMHVLIGSNGVGKSHFLNSIINDYFIEKNKKSSISNLLKLVVISFSPFDRLFKGLDKEILSSREYDYVGLREDVIGFKTDNYKTSKTIENEFNKSLVACFESNTLKKRWLKMISLLEIDGYFRSRNLKSFISEININDIKKGLLSDEHQAIVRFRELSSGHKMVLFSLTRLVEITIEKSLIIYDEPETYLHPPLLSAYARALSWLLIDRNAVAIVATHSPILLQEVPKKCVWIIQRYDDEFSILRPNIETFGESVSTLTREIFHLEMKKSGYFTFIEEAVHKIVSENDINSTSTEILFDQVLTIFNNEMGDEGMSLILSEIYKYKRGE